MTLYRRFLLIDAVLLVALCALFGTPAAIVAILGAYLHGHITGSQAPV